MADTGRRLWLHDRWYDTAARERLRQLALWSNEPVLLYVNTGLPLRDEDEAVAEVRELVSEGVVQLWSYEGETRYPDSLAQINIGNTHVIDRDAYQSMTTFVGDKLETSYPAVQDLGFQNAEGMLLEQVVLRRRFFTQAISSALGASGIGDGPSHLGLYEFDARIDDVLLAFFDELNLPSLALLGLADYLTLRERARRVLPDVVDELLLHSPRTTNRPADTAQQLAQTYRTELIRTVSHLGTRSAREASDAFGTGTHTALEARLALFRAGHEVTDRGTWMTLSENESSVGLLLLILDWRTGRGNVRP